MRDLRNDQPIGIFDSGIGGLTVANAITTLLPREQIIYFGDTAHLPYGGKSTQAIRHYADIIVGYLLQKKCKAIVIACNSASAAAYNSLRKKYGNQAIIINVIDPVVESVKNDAFVKHVGVIGTKATIRSGSFRKKFKAAKPDLKVYSQATPLLAPMIEEGYFNNNISQTIINSYLSKPTFSKVEGLVLACTHYPLIKEQINKFYQNRVHLFDTTDIVAQFVRNVLKDKDLLSNKKINDHVFYISDYTNSFEQTTKLFYRQKIHLEYLPIWD